MDPKTANKLQNNIYRKMPAERKIKIAGQLFMLGKKLAAPKNPDDHEARKTSLSNSKNYRKT